MNAGDNSSLNLRCSTQKLPYIPLQAHLLEQPKPKSRSVRDLILDSLHEIGFMTYAQRLGLHPSTVWTRNRADSFRHAAADEVRAFKGESSRMLWLAHGLTYDRAEPVKRLWGRLIGSSKIASLPPFRARSVSSGGRLEFAEIAMTADETSANPDLMRFFAADLAKGFRHCSAAR